ncbi:FUSC family protein [Plantactinospora sp. WMMB782]|uniref:FUSC family protein n=1 Tax=Plantactinospora sp. WMMB782 TaxID=3404121 RepID=UPI003B944758
MRSARRTVDRFDLDQARIAEALGQLRDRGEATVRDRWHTTRFNLALAVQAGLAAALAWIVSRHFLGNPDPVFAPIAAIGTVASSVGQRLRRSVELIIGVAVGIGVGDLLIFVIGSGAWQLGVVVTLGIVLTIFLGGGPAVVNQAAATAVLIVALTPASPDIESLRVIDALVGGFIALAVIALLLPVNPLRLVDRAARPALNRLADQLSETAEALATDDARRAQRALERMTEIEEYMDGLEEALHGGRETTILSPARWHRRGALTQYFEGAEFINHAVQNSGTLVRRAVTALEDGEPRPSSLPEAVAALADAVRMLRQDLGVGTLPKSARQCALSAVSAAGRAYDEGVGFSGSVVVAQVRTTASDLLRATGIERAEANRLVRWAVGRDAAREAPVDAEALPD